MKLELILSRDELNPVLEPEAYAECTLRCVRDDGTAEEIPWEKAALSAYPVFYSESRELVRIEGNRIYGLCGGLAEIKASWRGRSAGARLVVRPYWHEYHRALTMKFFLGIEGSLAPLNPDAEYADRYRDSAEFLNCEQVLELIRRMDALTLGVPKIVYLVGWQKGGHDHMYPAQSIFNERLKRPRDSCMAESLGWLIREARRYHTTVSLHTNLNDAYRSSPRFEEFDRAGGIARNADGSYVQYRECAYGEYMMAVSLTGAWRAGLIRRELEALFAAVPELLETHTIHVDNMVAKNHETAGPLDPYRGISIEDDEQTIREIILYLRQKGMDVTSEGVFHLKDDPMVGLQAMSYWFDGFDPMEMPASLYCGGRYGRSDFDPRFGDNAGVESLLLSNAYQGRDLLDGFADEFCLYTLPWIFLNQEKPLSFEDGRVAYTGGVTAQLENGNIVIRQNGRLIRQGTSLCVPVSWNGGKEMLAYGLRELCMYVQVPEDWGNAKAVRIEIVTEAGALPYQSHVPLDGRRGFFLKALPRLLLRITPEEN